VAIKLGIDAVGGEATERIANCLAEGGTLVNYGSMSGEPSVVSPRSFIFKDITLRGFWLALWFQRASKQDQMALYGKLTRLIATGRLKTQIHAVYEPAQIKEAIIAATQGTRNGKVLIGKTS
jgi:NADPH:quinone reductase-like Zn-dependent oxidoreductase